MSSEASEVPSITSLHNCLKLRPVSKSEIEEIYYPLQQAFGWLPLTHDAEICALDPTGFQIAFLGSEPVTICNLTCYDNEMAYLGPYIVTEKYRGKGFGLPVFKQVLQKASAAGKNVMLDAVPDQEQNYVKSGFTTYCCSQTYELKTSAFLHSIYNMRSPVMAEDQLKGLNQVHKAMEIETRALGIVRQSFWETLLSPEKYIIHDLHSISRSNLESSETRRTILFMPNRGESLICARVGGTRNLPIISALYATTDDMAKGLITEMCQVLARMGYESVCLSMLEHFDFAETLGAKPISQRYSRMYTADPKRTFQQVYCNGP